LKQTVSQKTFSRNGDISMKRLLRLQSHLLWEIEKHEKLVPERDKFIDWERVHMASCARLGYLMAQTRGVDPELASCACAVHDYGRIITGRQEGHAEAGYLPGIEFLRKTGLFAEAEIENAVRKALQALDTINVRHSKKSLLRVFAEQLLIRGQ